MIRQTLSRLAKSCEGAAALEFALIAPILLTLMLGVFQVGIGMQNYNALRSVSSDMGRYAVVGYQNSNSLTNSEIENFGRSVAMTAPYGLRTDRLEVHVENVDTPSIVGTTEKTIRLTYSVPSVLSVIGFSEFPITFNRKVYLIV